MDKILRKFYNEIKANSRVGQYNSLINEIEKAIDGNTDEDEIIIVMDGGVIQSTHHNVKNLNVKVLDYKIDGLDVEQDVNEISFPNQKAEQAYQYQGSINEYQPDVVRHVSAQLKNDCQKSECENRSDVKMSRQDFMDFFRHDQFHNEVTVDDCIEVFSSVLVGSSDITAELLNDVIGDYNVDNLKVVELSK